MAEDQTVVTNMNSRNDNFICGVVEGFYGRPWTSEQRKDLFQKLKRWGMTAYIYAPKDDSKHRAHWRDLYTVEEAEHLTSLIAAAHENGITFYYALSPGLDITYSSSKEVLCLKRKLEQVGQFGCEAFALLFDDIDPEMSQADKEVFQSFAHAQVSVTNDVYSHLSQPKFVLCPTQYCAARALPSVQNSEYLLTLGAKLAPDIDIMWTGSKVISRVLTVESIEEVSEVLKRPPLIWDNLHANDYDEKRLFLGPYQGRSPDLIPKLRGVVTNPNCEFWSNFVAIHTLAQWSHCSSHADRDLNESVSSDIKLETETEEGGGGSSGEICSNIPLGLYHGRRALRNALLDWLAEFYRPRQSSGFIRKPQVLTSTALSSPTVLAAVVPVAAAVAAVPVVNTCIAPLTSVTTSLLTTSSLQAPVDLSTLVTVNGSLSGPIVMNSLLSESKVCSEPMDCSTSSSSSSQSAATVLNNNKSSSLLTTAHQQEEQLLRSETERQEEEVAGSSPPVGVTEEMSSSSSAASTCDVSSSARMIVDSASPSPQQQQQQTNCSSPTHLRDELTVEDLALLSDLFYLPFEHGTQGVHLLGEFNWLQSNAHLLLTAPASSSSSQCEEWQLRARKLDELSSQVTRVFLKLTKISNRELLYELYPYIWEIRAVISTLNSYIKWLGGCKRRPSGDNPALANYTWFSKGWKESFMSGEQEPWVFRGGLTSDLQRLIPVEGGSDLFLYKIPSQVTSTIYTIRELQESDGTGQQGERLFLALASEGGSQGALRDCSTDSLSLGKVTEFLLTCPSDLSFIVEEEEGEGEGEGGGTAGGVEAGGGTAVPAGYALAIINAKEISQRSSNQTELRELVAAAARAQNPSFICLFSRGSLGDQSVGKRLLVCLLAALRASGSCGVYTLVNSSNRELIEYYMRLGFVELSLEGEAKSGSATCLGRVF